jgi:hypothetical protein
VPVTLDNLDAALPDAYDSDVYRVGRINGILDALARLGEGVDHSLSLGLTVLSPDRWEVTLPGFLKPPTHIVRGCDEPDWPRAVRDALTSVLVDDRVVPQDRPEPLARMIGDIVTTLGQLLAGSSLAVRRVWYEDCVDIGGDRLGAVGFLRDESFVFITAECVYFLGLGWSD